MNTNIVMQKKKHPSIQAVMQADYAKHNEDRLRELYREHLKTAENNAAIQPVYSNRVSEKQ